MEPSEMVGGEGASGLAAFILRRRQDILAAWSLAVRALPAARPLSAPQLLDHMPQLLERFARAAGGEEGGLGEFPEVHALERLSEGFDLSGVAREYALMRDCILQLWGEEQGGQAPALEALRRLDRALDEAVSVSVSRYARARERTLVALDRISEAALESGDAERFLPRLLQVLLETTEAVDTVLLFLREGEELRTRAAIGLEAEVTAGFALRVGEGFVGAIAQDATPRELHSAATDPLVKSELLRARGVKGLYGVPLVEAERVIGVAVMGSRSAHAFSKMDKMLFRTMVQRATMLLVQAHLRDRERQLRARAEESLAQTEALLAAAPAGVAFWDPQLRYLRVNETLARIHGLPAEAHVGRALEDVLAPGDVRGLRPVLQGVLESGQRCTVEFEAPSAETPDAPPRAWVGDYFPVRTPQGRVLGLGAVLVDVTERKAAEEMLRRWQQVFLHATTGVMTVEAGSNTVREVNPAAARMLGYAVHELEGRPLESLYPTEAEREAMRARVAHVHAQGHVQYEADFTRKDGSRLPALVTVTAVKDAAGQPLYRIVNLVDVTERRAREEALRRAAEFRERFLGIVSHDLRGPLNAIGLSASTLLQDEALGERHRRAVGRIAKSSERMGRMIRDLLDFTRGRLGGGIPIRPRPAHLAAIVRTVIDELELAHPLRALTLVSPGELDGEWDPDRIAQAVGNLCTNALAYSPPDSPVQVCLEAVAGDEGAPGRVRLTVRNAGPPIPQAQLARLFDPFHRGEGAAARVGGGLGLGLFIVQQIAEAHAGRVLVRSGEDGSGFTTHFTLELPRVTPPAAERAPPEGP
jgi:PAS domain S-box-containing protein